MATQPKLDRGNGRTTTVLTPSAEAPVADLLKQLGAESAELLRNEVALAKLEMREMARETALDSVRLFGALAFMIAGALTLLAAAVIGLGNVLDGRHALAALIVGVITLLAGGLFARSGIAGLKHGRKPRKTVNSLKRTGEWARHELRDFKEEITA